MAIEAIIQWCNHKRSLLTCILKFSVNHLVKANARTRQIEYQANSIEACICDYYFVFSVSNCHRV